MVLDNGFFWISFTPSTLTLAPQSTNALNIQRAKNEGHYELGLLAINS